MYYCADYRCERYAKKFVRWEPTPLNKVGKPQCGLYCNFHFSYVSSDEMWNVSLITKAQYRAIINPR